MRFGAHVPTRGHLPKAIDVALERGCEAIQIWVSNPRAWAVAPVADETAAEFAERRAESGIGPVVAHASYMVNIASPDEGFRKRSVELASRELEIVGAIGGDGLVVHAGSGGPADHSEALDRAASSLRALAEVGPPVLLELTAGGKGAVAGTLAQAAQVFDAIDGHPNVLLCIDTCHLFAAGAPLDDPDGVRETFAELRELKLEDRLRLIHANDSRDPRDSRRDRHTHVGEGFIGEAGFAAILAEPAVQRAAAIIETPGDEDEARKNLATLRRLAGDAT